jgi:hypothetical protein
VNDSCSAQPPTCRRPLPARLAFPPRSAKGHLLNAGICQLCSADLATIRSALERYCDIDLNFDNSREHTFLVVSRLWAEG